jgi:hypothetical protein
LTNARRMLPNFAILTSVRFHLHLYPIISQYIPTMVTICYYGWWISPVSPRIPLIFFSTWLPGVEQAQSSGQKSVSAKLEHQMSELKPFGGRCFWRFR